jgi:hypothetical protein
VTVVGVTMVRDEADVIAGTLRHMADEVDALIVADNLSSDGTRKILEELVLPCPLLIVDDLDPAYRQSEKMTALAAKAGELGATWIVPFDADELWVSHGDRLKVDLRDCNVDIVEAQLFNHFPSAVDPAGDDPFETIVWRQRDPAPLPKVAFRWDSKAVIKQGNHGVTVTYEPRFAWFLEVRHFPYRSPEQFTRKARNGAVAYAAAPELPEDVGAHWKSYGRLLADGGEEVLHDVFRRYFWHLSPADAGLVLDPAPYMRWRQ